MYVRSEIMDALEQSTEFTRKIEMTQIAEGGMGIETRVTDIDGVPIMEVIDDERFMTHLTGIRKMAVLHRPERYIKRLRTQIL